MFKRKMIHVIWSVLLSLPLIGFSAPHLQASDGAVEDTGQASGEKPFIMLLCKFPDIPDEQHTVAYYQDIMDNTYPGLDHFWRENSYGKLTMAGNQVAGWFTLPENHSRYVKKNGSVNGAKLKEDCANAADADVYFPDFYGINWMFNGRLGGVNLFSSTILSLDGVTKTYPGTVIGGSSDPRSHTMGSLAHEEGHIWGFPHSYGPYGDSYDSKWDVMSYGGSCDPYDPVYYCIPSHTIAKHKMDAGWISQDRVFYATPGLVQTVTIERHALPTSNQDPLIARVPIPHSKDFYTVESRKKAGYDIRIPGEAVVIHFKDHTQSGTLVVDPDGNGDPNDAGAMWLPGETFEDPANGVSITVNSDTGTGYNVTFDVVDLGYPDFTASDVSGPSTGAQGNLISVASTICNFGSVDWNDQFEVRYYLSQNNEITKFDTEIGTTYPNSLAMGACIPANILATIPAEAADGTYYIGVIADGGEDWNELYENNNAAVGNTIVIGAAAPTVFTDDATNVTTAQATLNGRVNPNGGDTNAWFEWGTTAAYGNATPAQAMGSGVTEVSFSEVLTGFSPGVTYHFRAAAQNSVGIAYGADKTFLAQDSGIDITPTDVNGPPSAEMGVFIDATATILNQGANAAGLFRVNLFLADDPQLNGWSVEIDRRPVESLLGGQSTVVNFNGPIPTGIAEGSYYLVVSADDDDRIIETDETNNLIADPITINPTSLPDLSVSSVTGPGSARRGDSETLSTTVENLGGGATGGSFSLDLYLSIDNFISASDIYLGTEPVSAMAGEESRVVDLTVTVPGGIAKGTYYLGAIADSGNVIVEASEGNNWGAGDTIRIK